MAFTLRGRRRPERGAVAVEFALVVPILILMVLGLIETSFLMRDLVSMSSSVRSGARTASASADAGPGTCEASANPPPCTPANAPAFAQAAAAAMTKSGMTIPSEDIDWVMIYRPGTNGYPVGASSLTCGGSDCVVYVWDPGLSKFRFSSGSWASKSVNACLNDPNRTSVGVAMQVKHHWLTNYVFVGGTVTLQEKAIMQFEPLESDRCKPGTPNAHS